jgi:uncharacterized phage protein (predicted DNA packaging)
MKLLDITLDTVKSYTHIDFDDDDKLISDVIMPSAMAYIVSHTGLTLEELNQYEDVSIAFLCLVSDMYDNRQTTVSVNKVNPTTDFILNAHRVNYF